MNETVSPELEPCLARLGTMPEDKPSFVNQVHAIEDISDLRQMLIQKERERQSIANDLDVAARLGLVISETNEAIQIKLSHLEEENHLLRDELERIHTMRSNYNDSTLPPDSVDHDQYAYRHESNRHNPSFPTDMDERIYLTQELEQARRELAMFRKEMENLSAQLNDMASEMLDSRAKVSMYAKRLAEVEHKLASTREMNANLQLLLEKALTNQKQSSSTTSHLVKNIQSDLSRVVTENDQLRARIADLESQQIESENRLAMMVAQAKEYAALLEQAQNTIHSLGEPRLSDDETMSNGLSIASLSSYGDGRKETEITKGPVFSVEFKQEMQKEFERNLRLRNEMRRRIITHESITSDRKKTQEGLKSILTDRNTPSTYDIKTSISASTSSSTQSSNVPASKKDSLSEEETTGQNLTLRAPTIIQSTPVIKPTIPTATTPKVASTSKNTIRPASFLAGFGGFSTEPGLGGLGPTNFITRGVPPRTFTAIRHDEPSTSTRFFHHLASRGQKDS